MLFFAHVLLAFLFRTLHYYHHRLPHLACVLVTEMKGCASTRRPSRRCGRTGKALLLLLSALLLAAATTPLLATAQRASSSAAAYLPEEHLSETLLLKPLADGRVLASFDFTLSSTSSSTSSFRLLPRALLQPIQRFGVSEVKLALNSGRWKYDSWGSPVTVLRKRATYNAAEADRGHGKLKLGEENVGTGAELYAVFSGESDAQEGWKGLTSSLAGLFCASLDALDEKHTVQPHYAYSASANTHANATTLHALLPTEGVCTENLTPFLKLLPCKNAAGLATLLNPLSLFGANFQGLSIHVVNSPTGGWQVKFTFTSVFSPAVTRDISIRDWSISSIFGRKLESSCPLADKSLIRVMKPIDPPGSSKYEVEPLPHGRPARDPEKRRGKIRQGQQRSSSQCWERRMR